MPKTKIIVESIIKSKINRKNPPPPDILILSLIKSKKILFTQLTLKDKNFFKKFKEKKFIIK